jgi:hypothetical protein
MNRFQASGFHLDISLVIATLVGCLIYFVWYPHPYFQVAGGSTLMLLIMGVDKIARQQGSHRSLPRRQFVLDQPACLSAPDRAHQLVRDDSVHNE